MTDELKGLEERKFSVKTVADLLGTNEETVRRWIRDEKLQAEIQSKKKGYSISESQLADFLKTSARYAGISAVSTLIPGFAPLTAAAIAVLGLRKRKDQPDDGDDSGESLLEFLERQIKNTLKRIFDLEKQMLALKAKEEAYQSIMKKNDSFAEEEVSVSQKSMSDYLTKQIAELAQNYHYVEQELLVAKEQLSVYENSLQTLKDTETDTSL